MPQKKNILNDTLDMITQRIERLTYTKIAVLSGGALLLVSLVIAYMVYSPAVITVNGQKLSQRRFQALLQEEIRRTQRELALKGIALDQNSPQWATILSNVRNEVANRQVNNLLLYQEAVKRGFAISDDRVDDQINSLRIQGGEKNYTLALKQKGLREKDLREDVKVQGALNAFLNNVVRDIVVNEKDAREYYRKNRAKFERKDMMKVRHIMTLTRADADECLKEIRGGSDFADVARRKSKETVYASKGGLWGYVYRGMMPQAIEIRALSLKPGEVSDIIEMGGQFHIIKVEDIKPAGPASYEEVKENAVDELLRLRQQTVIESLLDEKRKTSVIEINL